VAAVSLLVYVALGAVVCEILYESPAARLALVFGVCAVIERPDLQVQCKAVVHSLSSTYSFGLYCVQCVGTLVLVVVGLGAVGVLLARAPLCSEYEIDD
jgi:hypothetical protein